MLPFAFSCIRYVNVVAPGVGDNGANCGHGRADPADAVYGPGSTSGTRESGIYGRPDDPYRLSGSYWGVGNPRPFFRLIGEQIQSLIGLAAYCGSSEMKMIIRDFLSASLFVPSPAATVARLAFTPCRVSTPWRRAATLLLVCLIMLAPNAGALAQEQDAIGEVVRQVGVVTALRATDARPLRLGAPVFRGDRIITAADAKVEIEFRDDSTLSVGSETDVQVVDYSPEARRSGHLELLIGIIRTSLSEFWGGGFEVRTRAAVASVRSTEWVTEAQEERSSVFVISGEVEVAGTADGTRVLLGEGQGTDVEAGGAPSRPTQWGSSRIQDVLARTQLP